MNAALLVPLLKELIIPTVMAIIRAYRSAAGRDPTDAEVIAALGLETSSGIAFGQAWLQSHPPA